jgi:hypothetical protein
MASSMGIAFTALVFCEDAVDFIFHSSAQSLDISVGFTSKCLDESNHLSTVIQDIE